MGKLSLIILAEKEKKVCGGFALSHLQPGLTVLKQCQTEH